MSQDPRAVEIPRILFASQAAGAKAALARAERLVAQARAEMVVARVVDAAGSAPENCQVGLDFTERDAEGDLEVFVGYWRGEDCLDDLRSQKAASDLEKAMRPLWAQGLAEKLASKHGDNVLVEASEFARWVAREAMGQAEADAWLAEREAALVAQAAAPAKKSKPVKRV